MYLIPVFSPESGAHVAHYPAQHPASLRPTSRNSTPRFFAALACLLGGVVCAHAQFQSAGNASLSAIAVVPAARPAGLAGAYSALAEGTSALGINPAGLAREQGQHFSGSIRPEPLNVGAVAYSRSAWGGQLAFSASYLDYGQIPGTDENQNATGNLHPYNLYPAVTYARAEGERWRWGATLKGARETLGDFEGSRAAYGAGLDAGVQYQPAVRNVGFGASLTNVGRQFTGHVAGESNGPLPAALKAGLFYHPSGRNPLVLTADVEAPAYGQPALAVGGEYRVIPEWELRAGTRWDADDLRMVYGWVAPGASRSSRGGEAVKIAAGTSVHVGPVDVDYAAQWWRELGLVHSLSVAWAID